KAPWAGGVYERMIGFTKQVLKRAIGRKLLKERELITLIVEIEAILNSLPLTYVGFDDYRIIRPIDFLSPNASLDIPTNADSKDSDEYTPYSLNMKTKLIKYWSNTLLSLDVFWKLWEEEYLTSLRERTQRELASPKAVDRRIPYENEIVLLNEPETPRGVWQLARITKLKGGMDGKRRSPTIQLPSGKELNRSISALYPLEIDDAEPLQNQSDLMVEESDKEPIAGGTNSKNKKNRTLAIAVSKVDIPQMIVEIESELASFVKIFTTTLCQSKYKDHEQYMDWTRKEITREIKVVYPTMHKIQEDTIVLFDAGSESSFISRKLAQRLNLEEEKSLLSSLSTLVGMSNETLGEKKLIERIHRLQPIHDGITRLTADRPLGIQNLRLTSHKRWEIHECLSKFTLIVALETHIVLLQSLLISPLPATIGPIFDCNSM
ncbi:unnamed protein product, partial [Onchocerca ochengi]|uniref:DUF5641 domain-containing protein n=1 Tax=Onchocerca ochengi TaxID=42157 RepID=A0A182EQR9_ONCOC